MLKTAIEELESALLEIEKSPDHWRVAEARNLRAGLLLPKLMLQDGELEEANQVVGEIHQRVRFLLENPTLAGNSEQFRNQPKK